MPLSKETGKNREKEIERERESKGDVYIFDFINTYINKIVMHL